MNENAKNLMAITIQNTVAALGPMPDKLGDKVKRILDGDDIIAVMSLGCMLERYQNEGKYPDEPTKVTITMVIEKELSDEEVNNIINDDELDSSVSEYYTTLYNAELGNIARPNGFKILRCKTETRG